MNKKEKAEQKKRKMMKRKIMGIVEVVLRYAAAALMPSIPLFFLFNNNHEDNHIIFGHVLLLAAMLAIVGVLLLLLFKWIVKTHEGAIILSIAFWGLFWLYQPIRGVLGFLPAWLLLTIMLLIMAAATFCFRRFKISFRKLKSAFPVLFLAVIVIFGFNAIPAISAASTRGFGLGEGSAGVVDAMGNAPEFYIRREFVIDPALPNPDIYWIHLDGMTNLETVERFWGVCQQHVRDALAERGFLIYENAELRNAADTDTAITMLLSPALFDSYYGIHMANIEENLGLYVLIEIMTILRDDGIDLFTDILQHLELYNAFLAAGYEIEGVNEWMHILDVPRIAGAYIEASGLTGLWHDFLRTDLPNILTMTTPFNFANAQEAYRAEAANIIPDYEIDRPRLTWRAYYDAHGMFWYRVIPGFEGEAGDRPDLYPLAHEKIVNTMLASIDEILARNPDAVIVLQADHGLHRGITQEFMVEIGVEHDYIMEMAYSVFTAMRIPESLGGLDAPVAPLNVTRVLVNRFVGQNYNMVPEHLAPRRHR